MGEGGGNFTPLFRSGIIIDAHVLAGPLCDGYSYFTTDSPCLATVLIWVNVRNMQYLSSNPPTPSSSPRVITQNTTLARGQLPSSRPLVSPLPVSYPPPSPTFSRRRR